jgi:hypothetical protein
LLLYPWHQALSQRTRISERQKPDVSLAVRRHNVTFSGNTSDDQSRKARIPCRVRSAGFGSIVSRARQNDNKALTTVNLLSALMRQTFIELLDAAHQLPPAK